MALPSLSRLLRSPLGPVSALALLWGLLACDRAGSHQGSHGTPSAAVLAWENFPLTLDPRQGQDQASQRLLALTHQSLLKRGPDLELLPDACTSWTWTEPYIELEFEFAGGPENRARPVFADGRPLGAQDALQSIQALLDPALGSPKSGPFKDEIAELRVEPVGNSERLLIRLKAPDPGFPANLVRGILGITRKGAGGAGTGPYVLREFVPEQRIRLDARPEHPDFARHAGRPLDLDIRWLPDATSRLLALRHGSVDACPNNLPPDLLRGPKGFEVQRRPGSNLDYIAFNCVHPILQDSRVRRALSLALDRPALLQGLMGGLAREAWGFFPPELPFGCDARPDLDFPALAADRIQKAEALLDAAGFRRNAKGLRFILRLHATPELTSRMKALALQAQWSRLGVELQILTREFGTLLTDVMAGHFDVASLRWTGLADPDMLYRTFHSRLVPPLGFNRGRFSDREVDRLLEAARTAPDQAQRAALSRQVQIRLVDLAPYAFLWWPDQVVAARPGLDLQLNAVGEFQGVWER